MKITKVTYQAAYVTGPFLQHKIGFEAEVGDREDEMAALEELKHMADAFDRKINNFEERLVVPSVQQERFDAPVVDDEVEKAKIELAAIEFREDALTWLNNNGWTYTRELKEIANSKPIKTP